MDVTTLSKLLTEVQEGKVSIEEAIQSLKKLPYEDLGFAKLDHHRALRHGFPEVVWGQGKTVEQLLEIFDRLNNGNRSVLATRITAEQAAKLKEHFPEGKHIESGRLFVLEKEKSSLQTKGTILVLCAGTADLPVAEEAYWTAHYLGNTVEKSYDVGVAGLHRLLSEIERIQKASVIIVVAGMEGALASVVSGLAGAPVVGVPTSVGYGASFSGITPLFTMLSSCASGVTVANIDNGFGAAYAATLMNRISPHPNPLPQGERE